MNFSLWTNKVQNFFFKYYKFTFWHLANVYYGSHTNDANPFSRSPFLLHDMINVLHEFFSCYNNNEKSKYSISYFKI
jgi:hypothetical protein